MTMEKKEFDYNEAVEELEKIAEKVESPETGLDEIDKYIKRSEELVRECRAWLRASKEKLETLDQN